MKNILGILAFVVALGIPAMAQGTRMSPDDQDRFNSYYSRWIQDKQTDNRDDMLSMEQRMQDLMAKYGVASNTPYGELASRNDDRAARGYAASWQGQMSGDDSTQVQRGIPEVAGIDGQERQ